MKKLVLIITAIVMVAGMTTNVIAQNKATASDVQVAANIVATLTIVNDVKLDFGTMSMPNSDLIVTYVTTGVRYTANPSNIALLATAPGTLAHFKVTGEKAYHYTITLPESDVTLTQGGNSMTVNTFTALTKSIPAANGTKGVLDGDGKDDFVVGANLNLKNAQAAGAYTGKFDVTVTYD